jgi:hypothetical protein
MPLRNKKDGTMTVMIGKVEERERRETEGADLFQARRPQQHELEKPHPDRYP